MAEKLRIGIIGCGGIANGKHMPALKKISEIEMVAFCDIVKERAEKAEAKQIYNLSGQRFIKKVEELQPGVYIINGEKRIVLK